jgi:hypothetical protein|nr:cytochrome C [Rhodoferax sp.]
MKLSLIASIASIACAVVALPAVAADVTYRNEVAPMLKKYCAECHSEKAGAPSMADFNLDQEKYKKEKVGPRSDTYEHLLQLVNGKSTGAFMRRLDDGTSPYSGGKPGNMYKYLCEQDNKDNNAECAANLLVLKAWVGEGGWNLNRMSARGDVPALTKEQMDKVKVKY